MYKNSSFERGSPETNKNVGVTFVLSNTDSDLTAISSRKLFDSQRKEMQTKSAVETDTRMVSTQVIAKSYLTTPERSSHEAFRKIRRRAKAHLQRDASAKALGSAKNTASVSHDAGYFTTVLPREMWKNPSYKARLARFYAVHQRSQLLHLDAILDRWAGREAQLFSLLCTTYKTREPKPYEEPMEQGTKRGDNGDLLHSVDPGDLDRKEVSSQKLPNATPKSVIRSSSNLTREDSVSRNLRTFRAEERRRKQLELDELGVMIEDVMWTSRVALPEIRALECQTLRRLYVNREYELYGVLCAKYQWSAYRDLRHQVLSMYRAYAPERLHEAYKILSDYPRQSPQILRVLRESWGPEAPKISVQPPRPQAQYPVRSESDASCSPMSLESVNGVRTPSILSRSMIAYNRNLSMTSPKGKALPRFTKASPECASNEEHDDASDGSESTVAEESTTPRIIALTERRVNEWWFRRFCALLAKYDPDRLPELPKLLDRFQGKEEYLMNFWCNRYGPEPPELPTRLEMYIKEKSVPGSFWPVKSFENYVIGDLVTHAQPDSVLQKHAWKKWKSIECTTRYVKHLHNAFCPSQKIFSEFKWRLSKLYTDRRLLEEAYIRFTQVFDPSLVQYAHRFVEQFYPKARGIAGVRSLRDLYLGHIPYTYQPKFSEMIHYYALYYGPSVSEVSLSINHNIPVENNSVSVFIQNTAQSAQAHTLHLMSKKYGPPPQLLDVASILKLLRLRVGSVMTNSRANSKDALEASKSLQQQLSQLPRTELIALLSSAEAGQPAKEVNTMHEEIGKKVQSLLQIHCPVLRDRYREVIDAHYLPQDTARDVFYRIQISFGSYGTVPFESIRMEVIAKEMRVRCDVLAQEKFEKKFITSIFLRIQHCFIPENAQSPQRRMFDSEEIWRCFLIQREARSRKKILSSYVGLLGIVTLLCIAPSQELAARQQIDEWESISFREIRKESALDFMSHSRRVLAQSKWWDKWRAYDKVQSEEVEMRAVKKLMDALEREYVQTVVDDGRLRHSETMIQLTRDTVESETQNMLYRKQIDEFRNDIYQRNH